MRTRMEIIDLTEPEIYEMTEDEIMRIVGMVLDRVVFHLKEKEPHRTLTARREIITAILESETSNEKIH